MPLTLRTKYASACGRRDISSLLAIQVLFECGGCDKSYSLYRHFAAVLLLTEVRLLLVQLFEMGIILAVSREIPLKASEKKKRRQIKPAVRALVR